MHPALPTQSQLALPLLKSLESGGKSPRETYAEIAGVMGLPRDLVEAVETLADGSTFRPFTRQVRWTRQNLVAFGHISDHRRGWWELTEEGNRHLANAIPGIVITVYETKAGEALWADVATASEVITEGSVQSVITSPPYPFLTGKDYGKYEATEWHDWIVGLCAQWRRLLRPDGSLVLNLGNAYRPGSPTFSLYQERLLLALCDDLDYHLAQRFTWHNPSAIPSSDHVTVRRVRAITRTEQIYWLGKGPEPKSRVNSVLRPYSKSYRRQLDSGQGRGKKRPSGHGSARNGFTRDHGGALPDDVIRVANASSNDSYIRACRARGLPVHPARFPSEIPEFFIKLTTDPGDTVFDPFLGSATTGAAADKLGRRWIGCDQSLAYLASGSLRFRHEPNGGVT